MIADWLRDYIPTLVPLDLDEGLDLWRDAGWILGLAGLYFAVSDVPDTWRAMRRSRIKDVFAGITYMLGCLTFAAGMAMVDIGWLGLGVVMVVGLAPLLNSKRTTSTDAATSIEDRANLPNEFDDREP